MNIIKKRSALKLVNVCEGGEREREHVFSPLTLAQYWRVLSLSLSHLLFGPLSRSPVTVSKARSRLSGSQSITSQFS